MPIPSPLVMQQDIYVAIRTDNPPSALGTWEDPFDGSTAAKFDNVMATKVTTGQCVRLLPGVFQTNGNSGDGTFAAWNALSGVRIVGSGMGVTTLKLLTSGGSTRYAVGTNFGSTSLTGFEISDLTIDCNLPASPSAGTVAGAIRVRGSHVFLRRIKVIGYGAMEAGSFSVVAAAGDDSENCVIEDCVADLPATAHDSTATAFAFEGTTTGHRFCAIRNCTVRGLPSFENPIPPITGSPERLRALSPGLGLGTIIDGNQIVNCHVGLAYFAGPGDRPAKDIVITNNYFRNVWRGIRFENASNVASPAVGRVVLTDNFIELATATGSMNDPIGIWIYTLLGSTHYSQLVLRLISSLSSGWPGETAGCPDFPPCNAAARESKRSFAFCTSGP